MTQDYAARHPSVTLLTRNLCSCVCALRPSSGVGCVRACPARDAVVSSSSSATLRFWGGPVSQQAKQRYVHVSTEEIDGGEVTNARTVLPGAEVAGGTP